MRKARPFTASSSSARPSNEEAITIARLLTRPHDAELVEQVARESFTDHPFSIDEELARPWTRVWLARRPTQQGAPIGFLVAWHVADELHVLSIATALEMRRRGIATALMEIALDTDAIHHAVRGIRDRTRAD